MAHSVAPITLHATTVALMGQAVIITGASGSGKSSLALHLMALGFELVADDQTVLSLHDNTLWATCPPPILGQIEARFVGILQAAPCLTAWVGLAINMDLVEIERLPPLRTVAYLGISLPLLHKVETGHFAAAVLQYVRLGRRS